MSNIDNRVALQKIYRILYYERSTDWNMPEEFAHRCANELPNLPPIQALQRATEFIEEVRQHNQAEEQKFQAAENYKVELQANPITNAGRRGWQGYLRRQLLAFLNGTLNSLDRLEVTEQGLQLYQPFATVSQRTITYRDLRERRVVLSVNPPAYLDELLGTLRQFREKVIVPWGEIVVYEPGSGRNIATAIAFRPDEKVAEIRVALAQLHRAENQYENYKRIPRLVDLLIYYDIERWGQIFGFPDTL
ncbi:MAG: hypothetical protein KDE19_20950 [Caldilineaceae bacterium]|nr:hypothetical protein [Caldilineaceae bacterium]